MFFFLFLINSVFFLGRVLNTCLFLVSYLALFFVKRLLNGFLKGLWRAWYLGFAYNPVIVWFKQNIISLLFFKKVKAWFDYSWHDCRDLYLLIKSKPSILCIFLVLIEGSFFFWRFCGIGLGTAELLQEWNSFQSSLVTGGWQFSASKTLT